MWLATHANDIGDITQFFYCFRERELILDLFEEYCGARLTLNCMRPGGLPHDLPVGWTEKCREFVADFPSKVDEYEGLLTENRIWKKRTVGVGVLDAETAIDYAVSGPLLRGSGIKWDLRKEMPYEAYGEVEFDVPVGKNGDTYDRYLVRMEEMRQANRIIIQCLDKLPEGPVMAKRPRVLKAGKDAEVYHGIEGPKGEIGVLAGLQHAQPLPLPRAGALVHQPPGGAGAGQGSAHRRPGGDHRHDRHRARRGGPLMPGFLES